MSFYRSLFRKTKQMGKGLKFIQENFPAGARKVKRKVKYIVEGGAYGEKEMRRIRKTPEGRARQKSLKERGFLKTLRDRTLK